MKTEYINENLYSDIKSYRLERTGDNKGIATPVKKTLSYKVDNFCKDWYSEFNKSNTIVECGNPFDVVCRNGIWGYWGYDVLCGISGNVKDKDLSEFENDTQSVIKYESCAVIVRKTKTGKIARKWYKLGKADTECRYVYDYSF